MTDEEEFPASDAMAAAARQIEDRIVTLESAVHRLNNIVNELHLWKFQQQRKEPKQE